MHTNAIRLASQLISQGVTRLNSHTTANGVREIIRYPYDGQRYEIVVNPLPELDADGYGIVQEAA